MSNNKGNVSKRDQYLQREYGLTEEQWWKMWERQKGLCQICLKPLSKPGNSLGKRTAAVDHDHKTGRCRGLVDYHCNRYIIGRNRDTARLRRLINYLESDFDGRTL